MKKYSLIALSDTHNYHTRITIPSTDILVHCGDSTGRGNEDEIVDFIEWLGHQDALVKIIIAGNHDFGLSKKHPYYHSFLQSLLKRNNVILLENESYEYEKIKFYGSPNTPIYGRWAFMKNSQELQETWDKIPQDTDILLTHGPPYKILDSILEKEERSFSYAKLYETHNVGDIELKEKTAQLHNLKLHLFGHIHESGGESYCNENGTLFANVSSLNGQYAMKKVNLTKFEVRIDEQNNVSIHKLSN